MSTIDPLTRNLGGLVVNSGYNLIAKELYPPRSFSVLVDGKLTFSQKPSIFYDDLNMKMDRLEEETAESLQA